MGGDSLDSIVEHPAREECPLIDCLACGARDCPHGEPLRYDKDGCPACDAPPNVV